MVSVPVRHLSCVIVVALGDRDRQVNLAPEFLQPFAELVPQGARRGRVRVIDAKGEVFQWRQRKASDWGKGNAGGDHVVQEIVWNFWMTITGPAVDFQGFEVWQKRSVIMGCRIAVQ